ncbi:MAG: hypothetical protein ABIK09_19840 [Pseudomonadota bacterium]
MNEFDAQVEQLYRIAKGEETYGDGELHEQAARFRRERLLEESERRARARLLEDHPGVEGVDLLISMAGLSPETTIMVTRLLRPRKLVVVSSSEAGEGIDVIGERLIGEGGLRQQDFHRVECDPTNALEIYKGVQQHIKRLRSREAAPTIFVDITGGKKVMSAAAALVAWQLDLPLCYLDGAYDPSLRQPRPGTERLRFIGNPSALFGDQALAAALKLIDSGAFRAAAAQLDDLVERITEPIQARFYSAIARFYADWCDLDLEHLESAAHRLEELLSDHRVRLERGSSRRLRRQVDFSRRLCEGPSPDFLLSHFLLAEHYHARMARRDFAALLYYRTLEGCFSERLRSAYGGFDTAAPEYHLFDIPEGELLGRYHEVAAEVFPRFSPATALPGKLGFMTAALLLHIVGDSLLNRAKFSDLKGLRHLFNVGNARSLSVLAHGHETIGTEEIAKLQHAARAVLQALWSLRDGDEDFGECIEELSFLRSGDIIPSRSAG